MTGDSELVELLLGAAARPRRPSRGYFHANSFSLAAASGQLQVLRLLLDERESVAQVSTLVDVLYWMYRDKPARVLGSSVARLGPASRCC